ncbi:MAG: outer membrane lipoprotein carrier protein LolA [Bacteroidetes bacterium]|nr:outer membrane lipoprotein carrier protein LolA [Bacteroidota bacterium]
MKNLLAFVLMCLVSIVTANAQYDQKALGILDKVSEKYEKLSGFKADFVYTLNNDAVGTTAETKGNITASGKKFRLNMNGQEIISDGSTVWTYQPDTKEVYIDKFDNVVGENVNPSNIHNLYRKGFKYLYKEEITLNGRPHHVIELVPEKASDTNYYKIQLVINKQELTFTNFTIYEKNGNRYLFDIKNFQPNVNIADGAFTFQKAQYPGVTEVDMRDY